MRLILFILLIGLGCGILNAQEHQGKYQKNLKYKGPTTGDEIIYTLYLPPNYSKDKGPYPLIIFLHGAGGGNSSAEVLKSYERARTAGKIQDSIVVFPERYGGTVWRDGAKNKNPETNILKELLPHLEKQYALTKDRSKRTVMGFSMGAAGSLYWGSKHLDIFSVVVALDGGGGTSISDSSARNYVPDFGKKAEEIRKSLKIRLVQGGMRTKAFNDSLDKLKIPYEQDEVPKDVSYFKEGSPCLNRKNPSKLFLHNPACMTEDKWGQATWSFIGKNIK